MKAGLDQHDGLAIVYAFGAIICFALVLKYADLIKDAEEKQKNSHIVHGPDSKPPED